jgi:hypothetical protein
MTRVPPGTRSNGVVFHICWAAVHQYHELILYFFIFYF